ncbi:MFS transporter [soil metagenome]
MAVAVAFVLNGVAMAALLSRVPAVRDTLALSAADLGLLLLALSAGTLTALPLSGVVVDRLGAGRTVLAAALVVTAGFGVLGVGLTLTSTPVVAVGLAVYGAGTSSWDVAMNVEGAAVERRLGRTLMPRLHAGFSVGTVAGALFGAAAARAGMPLQVQLALIGPGCLLGAALAVGRFLPAGRAPSSAESVVRGVSWAWRESRTLLIGLLVFAFALTEGIANDWLALALVDGHDRSEAVGALGYGTFAASMTAGRLVGGSLLDRLGRVPVLRGTALLALVGVSVVVVAGPLGWVLLGAVCWGVGASLGFPVGMSAAADEPARAAGRVAVVSSIGYTAFLAGPPLVGFLADGFGLLRGLLVVTVAAGVGAVAAAAARAPLHVNEPFGR